jgi:Protein of unknown function (DUF1585)
MTIATQGPPRCSPYLFGFALALALGCHGRANDTGGPGNPDPGNGQSPSGAMAGTSGGNGGVGGGTSMAPLPGPDNTKAPYEPLPPRVYAAKVKDLLTGLPLGNEELGAVAGDPGALGKLVDGWMALPQFRAKLLELFKQAFQQTQLERADLEDMLRISQLPTADQNNLLRSVEESFARTALMLVDEGRAFNETVTTTRFLLNVPLMTVLAYLDAAPQDDLGRAVAANSWVLNKFGGAKNFNFTLTTNTDPVTGVATPIPFEETINPASPNFMRWTFRQPDPTKYPPCKDPIVVNGTGAVANAFRAMFGGRQGCQGAQAEPSLFTPEDWNTWKAVTIRRPRAGEERTLFWSLGQMRASSELVLATPRIGFMTTLAFFANWPTNPSNSYRVATNQALIVALGKSFDDRAATVPVAEGNVDALHIEPGTTCYACHATLDPMRDFFKQSYSLTYFEQLDLKNAKNPIPATATFSLEGSAPVTGSGIETFARALAEHPRFATAWVQKLCQYANATNCREDDPELKRVAAAFVNARFNFKTMVKELFTSPLVTFAAATKTTETDGVVMSIARRNAWCDRLSNRLGVADVCNQRGESGLPRIAGRARSLSLGVPGSAYGRADEAPLMPHDPNLFFVSATEKLCGEIAGQLIDAGATSKWLAANKDAAIADFVAVVAGLPAADARAQPFTDILQRHYAAALAAKEKPADALRSTFVLACASPTAVSSGI